jgi:chlorite dismutase
MSDDKLPPLTLEWSDEALAALRRAPPAVRQALVRTTEAWALVQGLSLVTPEAMTASRQAHEQAMAGGQAPGGPAPRRPAHAPGQGGAFPDPALDEAAPPRQFVSFCFYKVDPAWRRLPDEERARHRAELAALYETVRGEGKVILRSYSLVGTRADAELMIWRISYELEAITDFSARVLRTGLGKYLTVTHSFLAMSKRSQYVDSLHPEHDTSRLKVVPGRAKYLFVYPFVKTRDWYLMTAGARQGIMDEHIQIGSKYSRVKLNTTYSFGLDDQEFVVAFETNHPQDFLDLVQELRATESSRFTLRDTPLFTCVAMDLGRALEALG